ncbi:MAG: saccharopine dehydrogenase family protein [Sulfurospirillum sp.]|nr:saccharopine dehydrogenase family protein [Sulfurospirillum sp.]
MSRVLIIGAGGVGRVVAKKCAMNSQVFKEIFLASRTKSKCDLIASEIKESLNFEIKTAQIDANNVLKLTKLIKKIEPNLVINIALPYQDLTIMDACVLSGVDYLDTANYEHPDTAKFEYKEQWAKNEDFKKAGIMALLGSGFDPGVTNVFCAYAQEYLFDEINYIDILDCNAGDHGYAFATNFNPEINLREVSSNGRYWQDGVWHETKPMEIMMKWDYPEIGIKDSYLLYHEEMESLVLNIKGLKRIRFFMTFEKSYLTHMKFLEDIGMLRIDEVDVNGTKVVPLKLLAKLLPNPAGLGSCTIGTTNIGCVITGKKTGVEKKIYIYNTCDHQECFKETGAQAVSYTTGVSAMIGAKMILEGKWKNKGVFNMENFDAKPFMNELNMQGLPWKIIEMNPDTI